MAAVHSTQGGADRGWRPSTWASCACPLHSVWIANGSIPRIDVFLRVANLLSLDCFPITCFTFGSPLGLIIVKDTMQYRWKQNNLGQWKAVLSFSHDFLKMIMFEMRFCLSSLKSRINHSGKLTIPFLHFAYPTCVFQHLEQFPGYYFSEVGTNKGHVYFTFRQIKSDIPKVYEFHHCNQTCLQHLNKPDSDICSSDALTAATTKLLFYNGLQIQVIWNYTFYSC